MLPTLGTNIRSTELKTLAPCPICINERFNKYNHKNNESQNDEAGWGMRLYFLLPNCVYQRYVLKKNEPDYQTRLYDERFFGYVAQSLHEVTNLHSTVTDFAKFLG